MRKFGLIGYPLGHSFSQKYFTDKFLREDIRDCTYENFPIENIGLLPKLIADDQELCGINVTIPHKTSVLKYLDYLERSVSEIGAANVLKIKRTAGRITLHGFNSDVTGIRDSLLPYITVMKNALVLGTGGSSKAVCWTLRNMGLGVTVVSRTAKEDIISYSDINSGLLSGIDLIVNTTPLGMFPNVTSRPEINYDLLNERHILFDLVYNPELTAFLSAGKERGCKVITGLKMLYSQADRSWEIWNNDDY
jgi:shikimate dehydrogenase